jgi:hypothetical protein
VQYPIASTPAVVAVTPFVLMPLTVLALLFPALLARPLAAVRRWWVFLNVCTVGTALYVARFTFPGLQRMLEEQPTWWANPAAFWGTLALVAAGGALWVWRRARARGDGPDSWKPRLSEQIAVGLVSLIGLGVVVYDGYNAESIAQPSVVVWGVAWAGSVYMAYLQRITRRPALPAQGFMLMALAFACAAYGAAGLAQE